MKYSIKNFVTLEAELTKEDVSGYTSLYDSISLKSRISNIAGITAAFAIMIPDCSAANLIKSQTTPTIELVNTYLERDNVNDYTLVIPQNISQPKIKFNKIVSDILSFQSLKFDWDGYGAYALENLSGVNSISILENLGAEIYGDLHDYYPNPNGTLSFEWKNKFSFLGLEVGNEEFSYFLRESKENKHYHNHLSFESKNVRLLKENLTEMLG